jgi:hypothetical protein
MNENPGKDTKFPGLKNILKLGRDLMETLQSVMSPPLLTLKIATISTFFVAVFGILIAYVLAKKEFTGKWVADVLLTLPPCPAPDSNRIHSGTSAREKRGSGKHFLFNYRERNTLYLAGCCNCSFCSIFASNGEDRFIFHRSGGQKC